ncbi:MAG: hypothetical protein AAGH15_25225, partial [Myxococcota bacterium]
MREALLSALAAGLLAPVLRALVWRVPLGFLGPVGVRAALGAAFVAFVVSGLVRGVAIGPVAGTVGFVGSVALTLVAARRRRRERGLALLALRLADPAVASRAKRLLVRRAARLGKGPAAPHAIEGLAIAAHLDAAGAGVEAERVLAEAAAR